jgi:hypothetical protein
MDVMAEEELDFAFNAMTVHLNDVTQKRVAVEKSQADLLDNIMQPDMAD